jgi:hypothetical protein
MDSAAMTATTTAGKKQAKPKKSAKDKTVEECMVESDKILRLKRLGRSPISSRPRQGS